MMNEPSLEPNPITGAKHRRETFWQITFPFILGLLLVLGLAGWVIATAVQGGSVGQPADTALIFLILPTLVMALIPLVILAGLAYGVIWLNQHLSPYMRQAQEAMLMVRDGVRNGADRIVEPILRFKSAVAALDVFRRKK